MNIAFLKNFSAYGQSPMFVEDFMSISRVHPRLEMLAIMPVFKLVGKSTAAAFAIADADIDIILSALLANYRATWNGVPNAVNAEPDVVRDVANHALGGDLCQLDAQLRNGALTTANAGANQTIYLPLPFPFINVQKTFVNMNALSAGQLFANARIDLDLVNPPPALPITFVLTNGSLIVTALTAELWGLVGSLRSVMWMAPAPQLIRRATHAVGTEDEGGPLFDELLFAVVDAATFPNAGDNITITIDNQARMPLTSLLYLPFAFSASTRSNMLPVPGYDLAQNNKARAAAARKGRTPLIWIPGIERPDEKEYPAVASARSINFGPKTTAVAQLAFWRQTPITSQENLKFLATMLADVRLQPFFSERPLNAGQITQLKNLSFGDMAIDGGGSAGPGAMNSDLSLFKPRMFAPSRG